MTSASEIAFQEVIDDRFAEYVRLSEAIGGPVAEQSKLVQKAIGLQSTLLALAAQHQKPNDTRFQGLLRPLASCIEQVQQVRERNRSHAQFAHLSTVSESIAAFGWVLVSPTPAPYIKEMADSGQFYGNKVLVAKKDTVPEQVYWVNAWSSFLTTLHTFVRQHHTTGLVWNPRGTVLPANASLDSSSAVAGGAAPPPPPPPPPASFGSCCAAKSAEGDFAGERFELMKQLNIGTEITKGLRKVRPDQQTHKNPELRTVPVAQPKCPTSAGRGSNVPVSTTSQPPKLTLEGRKWLVEYQNSQPQLVVTVNEMSESVHIYRCRDSVIVVKGKANSIILDSCIKTGVVFDDIVSSVEFINCQNVQAQVSFAK
jgi:adenylyl cyclase-associated protein